VSPVLRNVGTLATCRDAGGQGEVHPVRDAALAWRDGRVAWAGPEAELPSEWADAPSLDAGGRTVVPGLVDCHTHLAFGGWRAGEFVRRIRGESYGEIARSGGGIAATVRATRAAGDDELRELCRGRLREMASLGVTTVEGKSGYGLSREEELRILRVYRDVAGAALPRLVPTFLGAHALPPDFGGDREELVAEVAGEWTPAVAEAGLARFCDAFVEEGAFTPEEGRRVLEAGAAHGLTPRLHADQLSDSGGAELAVEVGAASADHLEHVSAAGIRALADAGVVGVVLPLAGLYLGQDPAPARAMVEAGVRVAVATDFNPGTAPSAHLPLAMTLACVREGLTPAEALKGATLHAATALRLEGEVGSLEPGKSADFALVDAPDVDHWLYHHRANACLATVGRGRLLYRSPGLAGAEGWEALAAPEPGAPAAGGSP
jgi:imidazolonepropionase